MRLVFYGVVQGVGFRPAVFRTAKALGLKGFIRNNGSNVEVEITGDHEPFLEKLRKELPPLALISSIEYDDSPLSKEFEDFEIVLSEDGKKSSLIPCDSAICDDCLSELFNENDRRYKYPFINCTNCGARFSAIIKVPYDRENTSMEPFRLCEPCQKEYDAPKDRRFYAQTISCSHDGPQFTLYGKDDKKIKSDDVIKDFAHRIDTNDIGVLKSWGGMHIICNLETLERFRKWYKRPEKPFAIMVRNLDIAKKIAPITPFEELLLTAPQRPIVIVQKSEESMDDPLLEQVSPGLNNMGLYLPYSAIQHILFSHLKSDIILMTSANPPGEPIITDNKGVFKLGADCYLLHNRQIINRIDDSVIVPFQNRKFFIRKSRGFVPVALNPQHSARVIGVGAEENVTSSVSTNGSLYTSQYIGDVRDYNVYEFHRNATFHMLNLFGIKDVDVIACDLHPLYTSKRFSRELADEYNAVLTEVQHHWAHAVSLMIDNDITEDIICLTLDGAGYGTDGNIWGGEVLKASLTEFERVARLQYLPLIGGDTAVKDTRRLVFALGEMLGRNMHIFDDDAGMILRKAIKNSPKSSSFGRFLDAISCYLGVCCTMTYDGEPAIKLEKLLSTGKNKYDFQTHVVNQDMNVVMTAPLFDRLFDLCEEEKPDFQKKCDLAYSMASSALEELAKCAINRAREENISSIGISGGVSYNLPIVRKVVKDVEKQGFTVVTHDNVPNGDGGISVGQNAAAGKIFENS